MDSKMEVVRDLYCCDECFNADNFREGGRLNPNELLEQVQP